MSIKKMNWVIILILVSSCNSFENNSKKNDHIEYDEIVESKRNSLIKEYVDDQTIDFSHSLPSYGKDSLNSSFSRVSKIIEKNCLHCHTPNGNAPFSLLTTNDLIKRKRVIKEVLNKKIMPPWMADNSYTSFFNAPTITDEERAIICRWLDNESLKTNELIKNNETIKQKFEDLPDMVLKQQKKHIIKSNDDSYQCFIYDPQLKEDIYVSGVEFKSSNPEVIHHLMLYLDTNNSIKTNECWDCKNDGIINKHLPIQNLVPIQSWSKGMRPFELTSGLGYTIPKGSRFLLQTHYGDENNKGREETTTLKLHYAESMKENVNFLILNKLDILYPANSIMVETLSYTTEDSISILGVVPHAHFLTKKIEVFAVTKDQSEVIKLLKIPNWDYLWQGEYIYSSPVVIPKGSTIYCNVLIDNTKENPTQPNHPVRDVTYQTNSNDEMLVLVLLSKPYKKGDLDLKVARFLE
jgi:hypothetical protein